MERLQLASLGSGSRGNATVVRTPDTCLLVDCGFSYKDVCRRLRRLNLDVSDLDALLITHEHGDHCNGIDTLLSAAKIPVYMSYGTAQCDKMAKLQRVGAKKLIQCEGEQIDVWKFNAGDRFRIGDVDVQSVPVPHDAREPVQFRFDARGARAGLLTDLGWVTSHVQQAYQDCHALVLEFNHDHIMLENGPYPAALKRRIGGRLGHLSNRDAVAMLRQLDHHLLQALVCAHISEENNSEQVARAEIEDLDEDLQRRAYWASQRDGVDWITVRAK
ncbi:MAG: MBL fold metallo-hydrolase [Pseudomonadota bacterium]